jgi:putative FmdB family regulatory protein
MPSFSHHSVVAFKESLWYNRFWNTIQEVMVPMPTYEYECESCGIRFDRMQHFSDEPLKDCPECGGPVHRLIQPVSIIFKGSGFYSTDHRGSSAVRGPGRKTDDPKKAGASEEKGETEASSPTEAGASQASTQEAAD